MNEHEKRLRAILPTADEATLDAALASAEARGFARARKMAADMVEVACAEAFHRKVGCDTSTPMGRVMFGRNEAQEDALGPLADDIRAMQDDGGGA